MIYVNRDHVPIPDSLQKMDSGVEAEIISRLEASSGYTQARFKRNFSYLRRARKSAEELFNGKCCYCETRVFKPNIEHFRPTSSVVGLKNQQNEGYYWLTYKWFNLYLSCETCNRNKGNNFPVIGKRLTPPSLELYYNYEELRATLDQEEALLIDPCNLKDHTELHFHYDEQGIMRALTEKGQYSLDILQLNRGGLSERRKELADFLNKGLASINFKDDQEEILYGILETLRENRSYLALARQFIGSWFVENEGLLHDRYPQIYGELLDQLSNYTPPIIDFSSETSDALESPTNLDHGASKENVVLKGPSSRPPKAKKASKKKKRPPMAQRPFYNFIEWIDITNFKAITHAKLAIPQASGLEEGENGILLIGENGVGKSTILQAIALVMMGNEQLQQLNLGDLSKLIRRNSGAKKAVIQAKFNNSETLVTLEITKSEIHSTNDTLVKPTIGIGSIRRLPEKGEEVTFEDDPTRIMGLFRHDVIYPEIQPWLGDTSLVNRHQFNEAAKAIIDMLMIPEEFIGEKRLMNRRDKKIKINVGNGPESIEDMCDGHKSVIGYALYILRSLSEHWNSAINAEGLVIVDEIGNHLHPTWKIKVVSLLRKVFPRTTFIISTHDPLCLRSARLGEVWVMNKEDDGKKINILQKDVPIGMPLESLLTGSWFYMEHTTDEHTSNLIKEHSKQLFSTEPDEGRIKEIENELRAGIMQTPYGNSNLDTLFHMMDEVKKEDSLEISEDTSLRDELAKRLREQINS
ncbi:AAA family ATPase [Spongiimicrobium salis]|uniref:AAA family ATPase n=1 Tax=Spongiimicrobium salis TaxID=1667022 RepID=UPI00374DD2A1